MPCPACQGEPFRSEVARRRQARIDSLFGSSGIGSVWREAMVADFHPHLQAPVRRRLAQDLGFFAWGPVGVGKTRLLAAVLNEKIAAGRSALYLTVPDLLLRIKSTFDRAHPATADDATEAKLIQSACEVDWLGLDDLGIGLMTDWARAEMFQIVNRRYEQDKPIIATSNFTIDQLEADNLLGRPIVSRLHALCGKPIEMQGSDRRRGQ